jgi:hypothetical protein
VISRLCPRARRSPAVDRHHRPANVRSARGREIADEIGDFGRIARALERQLLRHLREDFLPAAAVAELLLRAILDVVDLALGQDAAGIDAHDAHAEVPALAAQRARERDQRSIAGGAGDVARAVIFSRRADHVDDHPRAALAHALVDLAGEVEEAEDLEVPGLAPLLVRELRQRPLRDRAGVVHQDVHVCALLPESDSVRGHTEVNGVDRRPYLVFIGNRFGRLLQRRRAARGEVHVRALCREAVRARKADAFRCAGDEDVFSLKFEIHALLCLH